MQYLPSSILALIEAFRVLPGVGQKTAERYTFHLLRAPNQISHKLASELATLGEGLRLCTRCQNYSEGALCPLCQAQNRESGIICVVAEPLDIMTIEESSSYTGLYHVLHGLIEPLKGIGPRELKLSELFARVEQGGVEEIILALDSDLAGEATAMYIATQLKGKNVKLTRLAQGLPQGGEISYTDPETLARALASRRDF